jgi:hypothetical protein
MGSNLIVSAFVVDWSNSVQRLNLDAWIDICGDDFEREVHLPRWWMKRRT